MYTNLKNFTKIITERIPRNIKEIAELRLMWADIVGEKTAKRSQIGKCELVPIKDEDGSSTGKFYKKLRVLVFDSAMKMAMTELSSEFLENIPPRYQIHSLDIRLMTYKDHLLKLPQKTILEKPVLLVSDQEKEQIKNKIKNLNISDEVSESIFDFLCICKSRQNKAKK
ncbi:MAG: hypothetical protein ACRCTJ_04910 [Brevinema sp.]